MHLKTWENNLLSHSGYTFPNTLPRASSNFHLAARPLVPLSGRSVVSAYVVHDCRAYSLFMSVTSFFEVLQITSAWKLFYGFFTAS